MKFSKSFLKVKEVPFRVEFCGRLLSLEKALFLLKKNIPFLFNFREQTLASFRTKNAEIEGEEKKRKKERKSCKLQTKVIAKALGKMRRKAEAEERRRKML